MTTLLPIVMDSALNDPADFSAFGHPSDCAKHVRMVTTPLVGGQKVVRLAEALVAEFGGDASQAAQLRAAQARAQDNPYHYCHWREVERVINWLCADGTHATTH